MINNIKTFEDYLYEDSTWQEELVWIRSILLNTELEEKIKWGIPNYCYKNKNVIGVIRLKDCVGIWFHQGVFLKDKFNLLINAQEGKTKGMRSLKIKNSSDVSEDVLRDYIAEAIENQKDGLEIKIERGKKNEIPTLLKNKLKELNLVHLFEKITQSKQNEFSEYIESAKREETKLNRIEKILPMIENGVGLNDKYRY